VPVAQVVAGGGFRTDQHQDVFWRVVDSSLGAGGQHNVALRIVNYGVKVGHGVAVAQPEAAVVQAGWAIREIAGVITKDLL